MLNVYELEWSGPSICDNKGDGLWINNSKIAIHIPYLEEIFDIKDKKNMEFIAENFYIKYNDNDYIEKMDLAYIILNDLVFNNKVYSGLKKNKFYTTLKLKLK